VHSFLLTQVQIFKSERRQYKQFQTTINNSTYRTGIYLP